MAGRTNARLNSGLARQRADELTTRLQNRMAELEQERRLSPLPPVVLGAALIVPFGLLAEVDREIHSAADVRGRYKTLRDACRLLRFGD